MGRAASLAPFSPLVGPGPGERAAVHTRAALDAALLAAHAEGDEAVLVRLYGQAANMAGAAGETDAACFFLTQAYVFALATGAPQAGALHARLLAHGREE